MTMNATQNQNAADCGANELYLRMRTRFDFSGNRTIGEFMMAKAVNEGYGPVSAGKSRRQSGIRKLSRRHPLVSAMALLISCALFLFCTVRFMGDFSAKETPADPAGQVADVILINTVSEPSALEIVFPQNQQINTTME